MKRRELDEAEGKAVEVGCAAPGGPKQPAEVARLLVLEFNKSWNSGTNVQGQRLCHRVCKVSEIASGTRSDWTSVLGRWMETLVWDQLDEELKKRERSLKIGVAFEIKCKIRIYTHRTD